MGFPGYAGWTVVLDPGAVATNRTALDINSSPFFIGNTGGGAALDWGTSEITEYLAQQGRYGSTVSDYAWPNRTITITLLAGDNVNEADVETALQNLREKVALFQREGGWLQRQRLGGSSMYADIVDAQLAIPDVYAETGGVEPGITLTLMALPDFYGDAVTLDSQAATGVFQSVLTSSGSAATISGDHPGRAVSLQVTDTSGNNQLGLLWGIRSRYYSSASTAQLVYQAEALTPVNGATTVTGIAGASSGECVQISSLPGETWVTFLTTEVAAITGQFTHTGTYNVWARVYSSTGTPQLQFLWGVGDLAVPVTNTAITLPGVSAWYLVNLGPIRLDAPPVGTAEWFGALQAYSTTGDSVAVDVLYLQPLDDGAGYMTYIPETPPSSLETTSNAPTTAASVTGVGAYAWTNASGVAVGGSPPATCIMTQTTGSNWLEVTNWGFGLPSTATIVGISVAILRYQISGGTDHVRDTNIKLIKGGTIAGSNLAKTGVNWPSSEAYADYGGATSLWGSSWLYSDINASNFGVAISVASTAAGENAEAYVEGVSVSVYYTLASGFTVSSDAVIYANQKAALRFDGHYREGPTGTVYGPVSNVIGDYVRIPASGMENRPCQVFVKPTRGDLNVLADSGLDGFTVQATYRPSYVFRP